MRKVIIKASKYSAMLIISILVIAMLLSTIIIVNMYAVINKSEKAQIKHIKDLENYYSSSGYVPINEQDYCDFDLEHNLNNGIKYNDLQYIATHNSYKLDLPWISKPIFNLVSILSDDVIKSEYEYTLPTLTDQLNNGIRFFEMDVNYMKRKGEWQMISCHNAILDGNSHSIDFATALYEFNLWSENNPNHLPVTIFIEPKMDFLFLPNIKEIGVDGLYELEDMISSTFTNNLYTPADMLREYDDFTLMLDNDDWPELQDILGKVLFVVFPKYYDNYNSLNLSLDNQLMFNSMWHHTYNDSHKTNTPFVMTNSPYSTIGDDNAIELLLSDNLFVRTRLDFYPVLDEDRIAFAKSSGAQILTTDYPIGNTNHEDYSSAFNHIYSMRLRDN